MPLALEDIYTESRLTAWKMVHPERVELPTF